MVRSMGKTEALLALRGYAGIIPALAQFVGVCARLPNTILWSLSERHFVYLSLPR